MLDPKVFKAYDIRGIYGDDLDEEGARAIGRAFVEVFEPKRIAVGHDMRVSSPSMAEALVAGVSGAGAEACSQANIEPVRPNPVMISSTMRCSP